MKPEDHIQCSLFLHLQARAAPDVFAFAVPNGGYRRPREAHILKATGVMAGVPDIIIIKGGKIYALELKTTTGELTAAQRDAIPKMQAAGATVAVAYGIDEALATLEGWGILR